LIDSLLSEKLTAVVGESCNIWVLSRSIAAFNPGFKAYEVNAAGINNGAVTSMIGNSNYLLYQLGELVPDPDGRKLVSANSYAGGGNLELYDFESATGIFSNSSVLSDSFMFYSACFSPDG